MGTKAAYDRAIEKIAEDSLTANKGLSYLAMPYVADIFAHEMDYLFDQIAGDRFLQDLRAYQAQVQLTGQEVGPMDWNQVMPRLFGHALINTIKRDVEERRTELQLERRRPLTRLELEPIKEEA